MPRVTPKRPADPFYADPGLTEGQLRRRRSADHEACHAATAVALGWTVTKVELTGAMSGECRMVEAAERTSAQLEWQHLLVTFAPDVLLGDGGSQDRSECWERARAVACDRKGWSRDAACTLGGRDVDAVFADAASEVRRLAATDYFQLIRNEIRVHLDRHGRVAGPELITLFGSGRSKPVKGDDRSKPLQGDDRSEAGGAPCSGCGAHYTPRHSTGKCASCRGGLT